MPKRSWASAVALIAAALLAGCGGGGDAGDATLTVYVSMPLRFPDGRDAADGARMALAEAEGEAAGIPVTAEFLDDVPADEPRWTPAQAAANARTATQDSTAIAYIGEFESGATRASLPVTNDARLLQVSPASAAEDLVAVPGTDDLPEVQPSGVRTFGRVIPSDSAQARAAAGWASKLGWSRVRVVADGSTYGRSVSEAFETAAAELGIQVTAGAPHVFVAGASGGEGRGAIGTDAYLPPYRQRPPAGMLVTSAALDPLQLPPPGRAFADRFEARYDRGPGRYAAYGYEAMAVILDSIERASDPLDRGAVTDAFFATADRDSILGTYSISALGETTLEQMTGYELGYGDRARPVAELAG